MLALAFVCLVSCQQEKPDFAGVGAERIESIGKQTKRGADRERIKFSIARQGALVPWNHTRLDWDGERVIRYRSGPPESDRVALKERLGFKELSLSEDRTVKISAKQASVLRQMLLTVDSRYWRGYYLDYRYLDGMTFQSEIVIGGKRFGFGASNTCPEDFRGFVEKLAQEAECSFPMPDGWRAGTTLQWNRSGDPIFGDGTASEMMSFDPAEPPAHAGKE